MEQNNFNQNYDDFAKRGFIESIIILIFTIILGISFIISGLFFYLSKYKRIEAKILKIEDASFGFNITVQYIINEKSYINTVNVYNYSNQDKIIIYYDPKNPNNIDYQEFNNRITGLLLLFGGIIIILVGIVNMIIFRYSQNQNNEYYNYVQQY